MEKKKLEPNPYLYPMPAILVGAMVHGKPNFLTVAYTGIMNQKPPIIALALAKSHYTNIGIREHKTFSVNTPPSSLVAETDYCGIVSGHRTDKSGLFEVFYGDIPTAPMIRACRLTMECRVVKTVEFENDEVFFGEIVAAYADEDVLADGVPDMAKLDPVLFATRQNTYWKVGGLIGKAWDIGKKLKKD